MHRIRLRDHWEVTPLADGRFRYARRFGRPRTLDSHESVWLMGIAESATVTLNGEPLGTADVPFAFDVTTRLLPRNRVEIETSGPIPDEVALEIRR